MAILPRHVERRLSGAPAPRDFPGVPRDQGAAGASDLRPLTVNARVLTLLRCPLCRCGLRHPGAATAYGPALICGACGRAYPVVDGVPRLVIDHRMGQTIAESFGFQWQARARDMFERDTLYGLSAEAERRNFFDMFDIGPEDLAGKTVLDAGCGDGFLLTALAQYPVELVGIDISTSIDITYRGCRDFPNVTVLQASLFSPPLAPASFDYVWCEGVLVHTDHPRKGFRRLADLVKPGGRLYIWVYSAEDLSVYQRIRDALPAASRLPHPLLLLLCYALALPLACASRVLRRGCRAPSLSAIAFALFDNLSPTVQTRHTVAEVRSWFVENGFTDVRQTGRIGMRGTKSTRVQP